MGRTTLPNPGGQEDTTDNDTFQKLPRSRRRSVEARYDEDDGKDEDNNSDGDEGDVEVMLADAKCQNARKDKRSFGMSASNV